jgi:hypothetical protein
MLLARRLISWLWPGGGGGGGGAAVEASPELSEVVALSEWTERTLYSSVLSSQRGTSPGVLLYMLPLGGGVSKAGGGHKWSSPESHFWCCMGSAVEAFGRLAESVYWRAGGGGGGAPRHLYLLQPTVTSELRWAGARCRLRLEGTAPSDAPPGGRLAFSLSAAAFEESAADDADDGGGDPCAMTAHVRIPAWADSPELIGADGARAAVEADTLVARPLRRPGDVLKMSFGVRPSLRPAGAASGSGADCARTGCLHGVFHGPLLLAALTAGDRRLFVNGGAAAPLGRWLSPVPPAARKQLATLEVGSGALAHAGEGAAVVVRAVPPQPPVRSGRRGGTDESAAATWRLAAQPADADGGGGGDGGETAIMLEPFDRPGFVLSAAGGGGGRADTPLVLLAAGASGAAQRWRLRRAAGGAPLTAAEAASGAAGVDVSLESAARPGQWVAAAGGGATLVLRQMDGGGGAPPAGAARLRLRAPASLYPPVAYWARSNASAADGGARRSYLLLPLHELLDEHYSAHLCVMAPGVRAPRWCGPPR